MDRLLFVKPLSRLTPFRPSWSVGAFFVFLFILLLPALCAQGQASNYFSLAVSPSALTVSQGAGGTDSLTITPNNGFIGTVYISVSGLPSGVTASFNPQYTRSVYLGDGYVTGGGGTVALTLNAVSGTLPGSYPLTLKAQIASSNSTRPGPSLTMPLTLTVTAGPPPGLTATATDAYISLSWQPVAGALSYDLYSTSSLQTPPTVIQSVLGTSTLDSTITLGQTYYYQVSTLTAAGESALSAPVTVTPLGNLSPVVKMTAPFDGSAVTAGTSLLLSASAMPRSGSLSKIDFYNAGTLIGTTTASPYNFIWNNIPSGRFFLTAVATDSGGHTATSQPITLTVLAAPSGAAITSAQAIQAAQTFCQAVGAPIPAATPTSAQTTTTSPTYPGTVWQIGFSGAATVEIADATSIVVSYFNETLAAQLDANSLPPGTPITQTQAQTIAASVLQAASAPPAALANQTFTQSSLTYPATYAGDLWTVRWNRVSGTVAYRTDQATLLLQAETGAVEAWKLAFPTPLLVPVAATVSQSQAQATAQAAMTAQGRLLGLSNQIFQASQQAVVQPDTLWPPPGSTTPGTTTPIPNSASRTVWDCFFTDLAVGATSPSGSTTVEIWVDAATGQVIGGSLARVKGHRTARHKSRMPLVPMVKLYR